MTNYKTIEQTTIFTQMVANKQGWDLNPDQAFYDTLVEGLMKNYNRYGYFLCPCRDTEGSREADKLAICPCVWAKPDIAEYGHCYCALYLSKEFVAAGKTPKAIPDRRFEEA
jgi:ferredoxin-thioredoxin reductase catalytic subunit